MLKRSDRKKVAIMCSANELSRRYTKPATEFASLLPQNGYDLIWGGSDSGLMKQIATTVQDHGGRIFGVTMEALKHVARENADHMMIAKDLGERKATMLEMADAIAVLVGGIGTLDEVTDMLEHKKNGRHGKLIVVLNTERFYEGFKSQLEKMQKEGFLTKTLQDLIVFANTPQRAIGLINKALNK